MEILILGSLPKDKGQEELYEAMVSACKDHKTSTPIDTAKFSGTDQERFLRAVKKVRDADLIIGEQTKPSTGQGIEIGIAYLLDKPLLVVAKEGSKVSGLVTGNPITKRIVYYKDKEDLVGKLSDAVKDIK